MVCLLWVQSLLYALPLLLTRCMQCRVILDRHISRIGGNCTCKSTYMVSLATGLFIFFKCFPRQLHTSILSAILINNQEKWKIIEIQRYHPNCQQNMCQSINATVNEDNFFTKLFNSTDMQLKSPIPEARSEFVRTERKIFNVLICMIALINDNQL